MLVTGGSRGIGRAIALELGRAGASLAVHYRKEEAQARRVAEELRALGVDGEIFAAEMTRPDEVREMVERAAAWKGRLDGLVTAAGTYSGDATPDVDARAWTEVIATDLEGTFRTIQAALPFLRVGPRASVVTVSSILGSHASAGGVPYQTAKAGVEQMTRALALELAPRIRVNAIAPGFVRTDMNRAGHEDAQFHRQVAEATPLGRWGEPEDIAPAVRYLLSAEAGWVTGSVLGIDGGLPLR